MNSEWFMVDKVLLATATTGLDPEEDLLIAACVKRPGSPARLLLRSVDAECLLPAQEFHRITSGLMDATALADEEFKSELLHQLGQAEVWTYNPRFQKSFVDQILPDERYAWRNVPLLYKAVEGRMDYGARTLDEFEDLAYRNAGRVPSFRKCAQLWNIPEPPLPVLPVEAAVWQLERMLETMLTRLD